MFRFRTLVLVPLVIVAMSRLAIAAPILFTATLTGAQENPPNASTASGIASFVLNDAQTALTFEATINGLDFTGSQTPDTADNLLNAHIHAGATGGPGTNAGVVWGFIGSPFNDTNPGNVVVTPFASGVGGMVTGTWDALEGQNTNAGHSVAEYSGRPVLHQFPHYSVWWWRDPRTDSPVGLGQRSRTCDAGAARNRGRLLRAAQEVCRAPDDSRLRLPALTTDD